MCDFFRCATFITYIGVKLAYVKSNSVKDIDKQREYKL